MKTWTNKEDHFIPAQQDRQGHDQTQGQFSFLPQQPVMDFSRIQGWRDMLITTQKFTILQRGICVYLKSVRETCTFQAIVSKVLMAPSDSEVQWGSHFAKARICTCNTWLTQSVIKFTWPPRNVARCSKGTRKAGYSPRSLDRSPANAKCLLWTIKQSIPSALSGMQTKSNESPGDNNAMTMKFFPFTGHNVSISLSLVRDLFSYWSTDWISTREIQIWHSWWNLSHFYCPTKNCY